MAGCKCSKEKERRFTRLGGNPIAIQIQAGVLVTSTCEEVDVPEDGGGSGSSQEFYFNPSEPVFALPLSEVGFAKLRGYKLALAEPVAIAPPPPGKICVNMVVVGLSKDTTAGLLITEVQLGDDILAANIGPGQTNTFQFGCAECEVGMASVKIVDANGALVAKLTGFPICKCNP